MRSSLIVRSSAGFRFTPDAQKCMDLARRISTGARVGPYDLLISLCGSKRGLGKVGIRERDIFRLGIAHEDLGDDLNGVLFYATVMSDNDKNNAVDTPVLAMALLLDLQNKNPEILAELLRGQDIEHVMNQLQEDTYPPNEVLDKYCTLLNKQASPVFERESEIYRIREVLMKKKKRNVLLLGDPGVGKSAVVEGLAHLIKKKQFPELDGAMVYSLDPASLYAGTKERGALEERWKEISDEILKSSGTVILFIDEVHVLLKGTSGDSTPAVNIADLMKPLMSRESFFLIASTTYQEHQKHFVHDKAFERRFSIVHCREPTASSAVKILQGVKTLLEEHHHVEITQDAVEKAVELTHRYQPGRRLPDKAIDLLDDSCLSQVVTAGEVSRTFEKWIRRLPRDRHQMARELEYTLKQKIMGQDAAIEAVSRCITRSVCGLYSEQRPLGSFFFTGPTGVGKTYLATEMAKAMDASLHRIDCSEYMEAHEISKLIGSPPGYIGYDEGSGMLYEMLQENPYNVLLLDEFEKAHPQFQNLFLQVLQDGILKNSKGQPVSFQDTVVIFTSNVSMESNRSMGFVQGQESAPSWDQLKKRFRPEFLNRVDAIVPFARIQEQDIQDILTKEIQTIQSRLYENHQVTLVLEPGTLDFLKAQCKVHEYGARQIRRVVSRYLETTISDRILSPKCPKYLWITRQDLMEYS